ncbi:unnamed protein product [Trichogramma brassicae]|uniref:Uncharacterized protein n=1 Tax=Trichogramma brassicae TaxID=86971 RepID=A0A6H5IVS0_9HYME|nr:unnamed protein product [Trichogramma brassicae]
MEDVKNAEYPRFAGPIVDFAIAAGYKDEPHLNYDGKPTSRRTTPIHLAIRRRIRNAVIFELFEIYDRFDVNYTDEFGYTHFHAACEIGLENAVEKFPEFRQDPNVVATQTDDSPLHLALPYFNERIVELLLRSGADPNLANAEGLTPLHVICQREYNDDLAEIFFKMCDEKHQTVRVDARDKRGRMPLHCALADGSIDRIARELLRRRFEFSRFRGIDSSAYYLHEKIRLLRLGENILQDRQRIQSAGAGRCPGQVGSDTAAIGCGKSQAGYYRCTLGSWRRSVQLRFSG